MNLNKAFRMGIFTASWVTFCVQAGSISFDAPSSASRYKNALDACMQVWGDVCVLRDSQEINAERSLLIDAALGRLVYLESAIGEIFAAEQILKPKDADVTYLSNLVTRLEACCDQLASRDQNERVKCFKPLVQNIKTKLRKN
jgi:hypothetical protein